MNLEGEQDPRLQDPNVQALMNKQKVLPNILVTGVPGVGKTAFAQLLVAQINEQIRLGLNMENNTNFNPFTYIAVGDVIQEKKLWTEWDHDFNCSVFDNDMVCDYLEELMYPAGGVVVDFHSSDEFPERWFDIVVLLRCKGTTVLYDRLQSRGYSEMKIKNNIECEMMNVLSDEVHEAWKPEVTLE